MNTLVYGLGIVAFVAIFVALAWFMPRRRRDVRSLYTEGLDYLLVGNLKRAYQCFKDVIEKDTEHISAYLKMGQVMRRGGVHDKALKLHDSLLVRPNLTSYERLELYKNLALDYHALGRHEQAVKWALAILKLEKRNTWALRHLVMFYRDLGDWTAGGKFLAQWQKVTNNEDTRLQALCRFRQGYDHRHEGDPAETIRAHYQQALKIDEHFTPAHYYLAESFADEAGTLSKQLADGEGSTGDDGAKKQTQIKETIAELTTQAVAHWSLFVEHSPQDTYRVLHRVEESLYSLQRFDDVEPFLRQVLEKDPGNLDGLASLANFYVRKGELDKAKQLLSTVPERADTPFLRAIQLKLGYRLDSSQNFMSELDHLIDAIRVNAKAQTTTTNGQTSLMSWLEPNHDPLESLA